MSDSFTRTKRPDACGEKVSRRQPCRIAPTSPGDGLCHLQISTPRAGEPTREIEEVMEQLRCRFREKFGRDPSPNDPIFFDPHSKSPAPMTPSQLNEIWDRLADEAVLYGKISPASAYAMKKTGLLVTEQTKHLLSDQQRRAWDAAVDEYAHSLLKSL